VHPETCPGDVAQGLLKHLLNEQMNTRMETVDAYMQIISAGSLGQAPPPRRGVPVRGQAGYDLHRLRVEITDTYHWKPHRGEALGVGAGDVILHPPTRSTALQRERDKPFG